MDTIRAVVQKVVREGKHGPFVVATSDQLEGSVTFSLEPTVWKEKEWPEEGIMVFLGELRRKRAGWRAKNGRFWKPSDEQTQQTERSKAMREKHIQEAQRWLGHLRNGTDQYDSFIGYVREQVSKGNLSLADIGTSEEELEELRVKGCKTAAQRWLGHLRNGTDQYDSFIGYVREQVSKGNLSLADIGTSEEELASFVRVST